jgi:hypothetical protein
MKARTQAIFLLCAAAPWVGCYGVAGAPAPSRTQGPSSGSSVEPSADWGNTTAAALCADNAVSPAPAARIWRLTSSQYVNTLQATFGHSVDPATLPLDGVHDDGVTRFDTHADSLLVNDRLAGLYRDNATAAAQTVVNGLGSTPHACAVSATSSADCARAFATAYASRAYRRAPTTDELNRLVTFYTSQKQVHGAPVAARMVLEALLQSPQLVYRSELGEGSSGDRVPLTQAELASELSYFLTDSPPDALLTTAVGRGELTDRAKVKEHALRLLQSPSARPKLQSFFQAYFTLNDLVSGAKPKNPTLFPDFTPTLIQALVQETMTFVDKGVFELGESLEGLFSASYSYQNATVAKHVGLTSSATDFARVTLPPERIGVLSHASVLSALSGQSSTSPIHRGIFFLQTLLCRKLPTPPANASSMSARLSDPNNPQGTQREQWTYFQANAPECASCHVTFQPMGLGLESFDPVGRFRTSEYGKTIDTHVTTAGLGTGLDGNYDQSLELANAVVGSPVGHECFVRQMATFGLGRTVGVEEACRIHAVAQRFDGAKLNIKDLIVELTQEDGFYFRRSP